MRLEQEDVFAQGEYRSIVIGQVDDVLLTVVYTSPEEGSLPHYFGSSCYCTRT
jgi:uncharacterized DUF497 family protein